MATFADRLALIITADAKGAVRELDKVGKTADRELGKARQRTDQWATSLTRGGAAAVAFSAIAVVGLKKLADAASATNEALNFSTQVFAGASDKVEDFAKRAVKIGQTETEALKAAAAFGAVFTNIKVTSDEAADMSIRMVQLASDLASIKDTSPEDALRAIQSGLVGQARPLRAYSVLLSEAAVKQEGVRLGLVEQGKELNESQKVQARYSLILRQTAFAHGDFERTSGELANSQRILRAELGNLASDIGEGLLPMFKDMVHGASAVVGAFNSLDTDTKAAIGSLAGVATVSVGVLGSFALIAGGALKLRAALNTLTVEAPRTALALRGLGTAAAAVTALVALNAALTILEDSLGNIEPEADRVVIALRHLENTGAVSGRLRELFGDLSGLREAMVLARTDTDGFASRFANLAGDPLTTGRTEINRARNKINELDDALVQLASTSGVPAAEDAFRALTNAAGLTETQANALRRQLDGLKNVAKDAEIGGRGAAAGIAEIGDEAEGAAGKVNAATVAIKRFGAALATVDAGLEADTSALQLAQTLDDLDAAYRGVDSSASGAGGSTQTAAAAAIDGQQKHLSYRDALVGVADASRNVQRAQADLADARKESQSAVEDLAAAEAEYQRILTGFGPNAAETKTAAERRDDARRAQRGARLDVSDAGQRLAEAKRSGSGLDRARAQLGLEDAQDRLQDATRDLSAAEKEYQGFLKGFPKTSDKAKGAAENLTDARDASEAAILREQDASLSLSAAQRATVDAALNLRRAEADLKGQLDATGGSAGTAGKAMRELASMTLDAKKEVVDFAKKQAEASGALEGSRAFTLSMIAALGQLGDTIRPGSPLHEWLSSFTSQLRTLLEHPTGGALVAAALHLPAGVSLGAALGGTAVLGRQHGGPVAAGRPYVVGERGPELFVPRTGGNVLANGAGGTTNFTIIVNDGDPNTIISTIDKYLRQNGYAGLARSN